MSQEIVFTSLPNGRTEKDGKKYLKLSVFTTIQVKTPAETTLNEFEDILNWPDRISGAKFMFSLGSSEPVEAIADIAKIDSSLYKSIFHKDIRLKGYLPEDFKNLKFNSFSAINIKNFLVSKYVATAIESPDKLISAERFIDDDSFGLISPYRIDENALKKVNVRQAGRQPAIKGLMIKRGFQPEVLKSPVANLSFSRMPKKADPAVDFAHLRNFHRIEKWKRTRPVVPMKKPEFEFHQVMAILSNYPQLMRKAGFIIDFEIPYSESLPAIGGINLLPSSLNFTEDNTIVSVPATAYAISQDGFITDDREPSIFRRGFVKINTDDFDVIQVDADGAALKAHNLAENKTQQIAQYFNTKGERKTINLTADDETPEVTEVPEDEGLPFIRSAGIALVKNDMAEHLVKRIEANINLRKIVTVDTPLNVSLIKGLKLKIPDTRLFSSDIIQGYRMDIAYESDPGKWYSLHFKQDKYEWYDEASTSHPVESTDTDEGFIELGITEDPEDPADVFVSDTIARWEGWSLSVGKPGFAINHPDDSPAPPKDGIRRDFVHTDRKLEAKKYAFDPDLQFRVNASSKIVAGTLPKLRFGKDYRIRIRAVDLAGNSLPVTMATADPDITERRNIRYMRYEPLGSPIVLVGNDLKDGEFLERLVIRSNFDKSAASLESTETAGGKAFDPYSRRYLLPPDNSQAMAETHGMFEKAFTGNPAAAKEIYDIIATHEGHYDREKATVEKIYTPSEAVVVYLPDPMAAGVAFFASTDCGSTHSQDFFKPRMFGFFSNEELNPDNTNGDIPADWYNARAVTLRLEEGDFGAIWNKGERTLVVTLPKGMRCRIKFSTFCREKDFKQFSAIWSLIKEQAPSNISELERKVKAGQHWMISPSREFELIHATRQPVEAPEIKALIPVRDFDDTTADINIRFAVHGESTEKVSLHSRWTEPSDDGVSVYIKETGGANSIDDIKINYHDDVITRGHIPEFTPVNLKAEPKIMFQPQIDFKARTNAEFRLNPQPGAKRINNLHKSQSEAFDQLQSRHMKLPRNLVNDLRFDIEASRFSLLKMLNLRIVALRQNFGDTRHRWVDYYIVASGRYREYFAKILTRNPDLPVTRESGVIEKINILSTARPAQPEIDYIIPTFEWVKAQNGNTITHSRLGGGLRVWLKRPWFSSGEGEMLAVVLVPPQGPASAKTPTTMAVKPGYTNLYTHWGLDPLHVSNQPSTLGPEPPDFRFGPLKAENLQYPGSENMRAQAVAYPVSFDADKQMWYCDMAINPGIMYFPFVRLALARYQQHSVRKGNEDVCLSQVVLSDMMQLMPERTATVEFKNDESNSRFTITISGTIYNSMGTGSRFSDNIIRISFASTRLVQPINGLVDDQTTPRDLVSEAVELTISPKDIVNNRFTVSSDFRLPKEYKKAPFEIVVREFEQVPVKTHDVDKRYDKKLERSPENEKLVYADVFKINSTDIK